MTSLPPKLSNTSQILNFFHCFSNRNNNSEVYLENLPVHRVHGRCKGRYSVMNESHTMVHEAAGRQLYWGYLQAVSWMKHAVLRVVVSNSQKGMGKP